MWMYNCETGPDNIAVQRIDSFDTARRTQIVFDINKPKGQAATLPSCFSRTVDGGPSEGVQLIKPLH